MADSIIRRGLTVFGQDIEYHQPLRLPVALRAIFDAAYQEVDPQTGVSIGSTAPAIDIRLADLPEPPSPGDRVCIKGDFFRVMAFQPDGQGAAKLLLQRIP